MAALSEQVDGIRFLEVIAADLSARHLRRDREHRHAVAMTVVQAVDQVHVAGTAAARAHGQMPR
jgi:hypothetical protein